jgi:hypothetical protein
MNDRNLRGLGNDRGSRGHGRSLLRLGSVQGGYLGLHLLSSLYWNQMVGTTWRN